uniref:Uncharacterized protein n=4 Tax=Meloidogyne TaxID=189290 RepID=A0A6V7V581_MELEN|nr:unnamed protein product [Meloidogyne enterolobii]
MLHIFILVSAATTTTALLAFQLLWPFLICGTLLGLFTCCRKKAKTDANSKSQVGPSSSTRTALDDSKKGSQKGKPKKKDNLSSKKDAGVATSADGFPIFPILKTDNSTVVCTLSASTNTPNDDNNTKTAYTMQSMTKSLVKSAPKTAKAPVPQKEAAPPAEPASKEEKPAKAPTDAKTMVTKEESSKATSKVETPKSATSKTEPSKPETSKDSPATPVSTPKEEEEKTKKTQESKETAQTTERSTEATKSGTDLSTEEQKETETTDKDNSNKDSNKDASDKEKEN